MQWLIFLVLILCVNHLRIAKWVFVPAGSIELNGDPEVCAYY